MQSMFGERVLFLLVCVGLSVVVGCARDPVIPAADIPAIPPSTRAATQAATSIKHFVGP